MKKVGAIVIVLLVCGCNQNSDSGTPFAKRTESDSGEKNVAVANVEASTNPEVAAFNQDLEQLAELATQAEAKYDFVAATKVWAQLQQLLAGKIGENAWQTTNARLAYETAYAKSKFSAEQMQTWKQIENLQSVAEQNMQSGELQAAYTTVRQLAELQKKLFGADSFAFAQALIHLATVDASVGQFEMAINNFNDSLAIFNSLELHDHPERIMIHAGLADAYLNLKKMKTAAANQKEAVRITGMVWGKQSLELATQANQLAAIFHRSGNLKVAEEIFMRSLEIREKLLGPEHQAVGHSCLNLGVVLMDERKLGEAERVLDRASHIFLQHYGADAAISQRCNDRLATVYMLLHQPEKAEPMLKGILQNLARTNTPDSETTLKYQFRLSIALGRQGKYAEAEPIMRSVLDFQQHKFGDADPRTVATLEAYAMLLDRTNKGKSAEAIRQRINRVAHQMDNNDFQRR